MVRNVLARRALIVTLLIAFVALSRVIPERGGTTIDIAVANWLEAHDTDSGAVVFTWVSWLGDTALSGLLVAAALLLLHRRRALAAATVVVATVGGMLINPAIKPFLHRPRPDYAIDVLAGHTFSYPSGHAMASIIGFGIVAYFRRGVEPNPARQHFIVVIASVIVLAVGFSRLYLGVHYFTDVLGGFLVGAAWMLLCIEGYRAASRHLSGAAERRVP